MIKTIKPQDFAIIIEDIVTNKKIASIGNLKAKLREEATALHFLPKSATIPGL